MARIFISYKRVDKEKVFKIKAQIESALGEKCWIDLDGIESDDAFVEKIITAIDACEVFLFMYSAQHADIKDYQKDWTVRELQYAERERKRIVFVNIDGSDLSKWFSFMFGAKQQVDGTSDNALCKLFEDLEGWLFPDRIAERERKLKEAEEKARLKLQEEENERIQKEAAKRARIETEEKACKEAEEKAKEEARAKAEAERKERERQKKHETACKRAEEARNSYSYSISKTQNTVPFRTYSGSILSNNISNHILRTLKWPVKLLNGLFSLWGLFLFYGLFFTEWEAVNDLVISISFTVCTFNAILFANKYKYGFIKYASMVFYISLILYNIVNFQAWYEVQEDWEYCGMAFLFDIIMMLMYNIYYIINPGEYEKSLKLE